MGESERAVFSIHINATREAVWEELTKTDEPQDAFYHEVLHSRDLEPGTSYQMRSMDGRIVGTVGKIVKSDPPNMLQRTLKFTQYDDPEVTLTCEITDSPDGGVEFTLTVDGLMPDTKTAKSLRGSGGGEWICKTLKKIVENGRSPLSTRLMYKVIDVFGPKVLPKQTRAENWPAEP